jgi:type III secretion protein T
MTSDYLTFVTSIPNFSPMSVSALFFLGLMRIAPIVSIAPFLGAKLPGGVKIGLAITLTMVFLPHIIATTTHPPHFNALFIGYALKELFMGFILAFLVTLPFYIAQSSGVLIDFLRGSSALMVTDPIVQTQVSPLGLLYNYVLVVLFFQIDGPFIFFEGVARSFSIIPADQFLNAAFFTSAQPFWKTMFHMLTQFTAVAIQLAAPSLVAILMAEMFLGIANRLAPQVQIAFLGMALKSLLGIAILWVAWFFILQQMGKQALIWLTELNKIVFNMRM